MRKGFSIIRVSYRTETQGQDSNTQCRIITEQIHNKLSYTFYLDRAVTLDAEYLIHALITSFKTGLHENLCIRNGIGLKNTFNLFFSIFQNKCFYSKVI